MGKELGQLIRKSRETVGLSQNDVAKVLNVRTPQSVSNIERGVSPLPAGKIKALANLIQLPPTQLVDVIVKEKRAKLLKAAGVRR